MQYSLSIDLAHEQATQSVAQQLAQVMSAGVVYLIGDLGAGKTTLTRFWLQSLGHRGAVKSPTYTLVEPYRLNHRDIFHFDLYRLNDPYELELMGIRDYLDTADALFLFEWPSKGGHEIPKADLILNLDKKAEEDQRQLTLQTDELSLYQTLQDIFQS